MYACVQVRPPVKTRLSAREAVSRDAVLCIQEGRREDFKQLLVSCSQQLQHFGAVHAAIILQTLAIGDCEVRTVLVTEKLEHWHSLSPDADFTR